MGWTGIRTKQSFKDVFDNEFRNYNVLQSSFLKCQRTDDNEEEAESFHAIKAETGYVWGLVILWNRNDGEVHFKEMDEGSGPYTVKKCSKSIIKLLSPISELANPGYSKEWRERQ